MKSIAVIHHSAHGHSGHIATQVAQGAPADTFAPGDVKTARRFGRHFANTLMRVSAANDAVEPSRRSA